ncbi:MAG: hypothetical protein ABSA93_09555 [Streptosporangiaceae bacterium]
MLVKPSAERVPADARRCHATGSRVADDAAGRSCPLVTAPSFRTFRGLAVARLVVTLLVPAGELVVVAIDGTLSGGAARRYGPRRGSTTALRRDLRNGVRQQLGGRGRHRGLPALSRPAAIPVPAKLVITGTSSASRLWLARRMAAAIAALPGPRIHVAADPAYAGGELKKLPPRVTWTTRLRTDAALYELPPARTGRRRPTQGQTRSASLPRRAGRHLGVHPGHRHPLRHDRDHPGRRRHLPAALGLRHPPRHRRPHPRPGKGELRPSPGHHRRRRLRLRRGRHRTLCRQMVRGSGGRRQQAGTRTTMQNGR